MRSTSALTKGVRSEKLQRAAPPAGSEPATHCGLHDWIANDVEPEDVEGQIISVRLSAQHHFTGIWAETSVTIAAER
jgi:hypothetical protein